VHFKMSDEQEKNDKQKFFLIICSCASPERVDPSPLKPVHKEGNRSVPTDNAGTRINVPMK